MFTPSVENNASEAHRKDTASVSKDPREPVSSGKRHTRLNYNIVKGSVVRDTLECVRLES